VSERRLPGSLPRRYVHAVRPTEARTMPPRILLTTTSFQDTPGDHHDLLAATGWEVVKARGPLSEADTLAVVGEIDGYICGDDAITRAVLEKARPRLKVLSKYGIGVDKIDVKSCTEFGIPLLFTPGVNHTTVAEHAFLLLLALEKHLLFHADSVRAGGWKRQTGRELLGKTIGIVGMGRIGKEVAIRAKAFGMKPIGYDVYWDEAFAKEQGVPRADTLDDLFAASDYISLHTNLTPETRDLVRAESIARMKPEAIVINCARGEIVNTADMAAALHAGRLRGYGTDVLDEEPPRAGHPLVGLANCLVTPHVGSRTLESVQRQAVAAVTNLIRAMHGQPPLAQVNPEVPVRKVV
jgi:D-3-phosphoglycerate dehydrogenase